MREGKRSQATTATEPGGSQTFGLHGIRLRRGKLRTLQVFLIVTPANKAWIPKLIAAAGPEVTETCVDFS
jgi:hypothetical protein